MNFIPFWKTLAVANLILGLFLWFLFLTDYSLVGNVPDIIFPPSVGIIAFTSLSAIKFKVRLHRRLATLTHLPSIIGGGMYILTTFLMLIPPFTLGTVFTVSEIADESLIQKSFSPNGTQIANVYFRGVGAYSGGNRRIFVRIRYPFLPMLERDVFYLRASYASDYSANYLEWRDDNTIYISEIDQEMSLGIVKPETPVTIKYLAAIVYFLYSKVESLSQTKLVKDLPIYEGNITHDQAQYQEEFSNVFRSFNLPLEDVNKVAEWYEDVLSRSPWSLVKVDNYTTIEDGVIHFRHCIQTSRIIDDKEQLYYWEFMGNNAESGVHVNIGTPNPITDTCKRYAGES